MNQDANRIIKRMKKSHRNVYGISDNMFALIAGVIIFLWVAAVTDAAACKLALPIRVTVCLAIASVSGVVSFFLLKSSSEKGVPYTRQNGFQFLGLHDLRNSDLKSSSDVLQRNEEIIFMKKVLDEIIFPQSAVKQALCLVGPSGCGKSTILAFFREQYKDEITCYDFSGNYHELESAMASNFGTNIDVSLAEHAAKRKIVIILDQFERYFYLSPKEQQSVRKILHALSHRNTAVILSLREEYLADFLKQFDMNDLKEDPEEVARTSTHGIFHELVSIIWKNSGDSGRSGLIKPAHTVLWEDNIIKNNGKVYLNSPFPYIAVDYSEQMGITTFYCQSDNQVSVQANGKSGSSSVILDKCRRVFGKAGEAFFKKNQGAALVEQQILFHMAEFNQKIHGQTPEEVEEMFDLSRTELLNRYFDVQLSSCDDYFLASRILYLYSKARESQIFIRTDDVEKGIFSRQFGKSGYKSFMKTIEELENLQLIRKNSDGSTQEYEIAHDFIAQAFLKYCENSMNRDVKNSLDLFLSEYRNEQLKKQLDEKYAFRFKKDKDKFFRYLTAFSVVVMILGFLAEVFIWNPWTGVLQGLNPYGEYVPFFPLVITIVSVIYLCCLYDRAIKYFKGRSEAKCKTCFVVLMLLAVLAVLAYPHFLLLDSIDLVIAALDISLLLNNDYRPSCRAQLQSYGLRSILMGTIYAIGHVVFCLTNPLFDTYLIFAEAVMFTVLAIYACLAHLTKEYLYSRMSDATSEKK